MSRAVLILANESVRERAHRWVGSAPVGTRLEFKEAKRTTAQNDKMWALLTELSLQCKWHGQVYSPDDWKDYMMHALRKARWMPDEDGGMVPIGLRTSDLSKAEMGDLIELIYEFGARHGVTFSV